MREGIVLFFVLFSLGARADFSLAPRYEYISGNTELANRLILKSKFNANAGPFGIYLEGFGDFDGATEAAAIRRSSNQGYLQEGYVEFKLDSIYIRVGRQAMRWSESWSIPSLDVWTGRRLNRLFFDPLSEQLTHSFGMSFSYASQSFGLDLVAVNELAEFIYPEPYPRTLATNEDNDNSFGARIKFDLGGFGFSAMAAQVLKKGSYGMSANYAFEKFVPKFEFGGSHDETPGLITNQDEYFSTFGCDIFLGSVILLPQITVFDFGNLRNRNNDYQSAYYLSMQWNPNKHDLQTQVFFNTTMQDSYASLSYGYNLTDYFTMSGFVQNYEGSDGSLYKSYKDMTGGFVAGVRFEFTGNLAF